MYSISARKFETNTPLPCSKRFHKDSFNPSKTFLGSRFGLLYEELKKAEAQYKRCLLTTIKSAAESRA